MRGRVIAATALLFLAEHAGAQTTGGDGVLQSLLRCRALPSPEAQLDCFNKATSTLEAAVRTKEVTILDRQDVRKARRSLFGFTLPRIPLFGERDKDGTREDFEQLETTIAGTRTLANGRFEIRLAEGDAVWATTDPMSFPPKTGSKIRIRRGALGNYFLNIQGERSVRGMRLR